MYTSMYENTKEVKKMGEEERKAFVESQLIDLTEEEQAEEEDREARSEEERIMGEVDK